jgi:F-type H+-transporting ATPase subunit epsilon
VSVADAKLDVEVVSVEKKVWTGEATFIRARTVDGEIGILPGHWDHLSVLVPGGVIDIRQGEESTLVAVHGGFLHVHDNQVRILAEVAELGEEVDAPRARTALERSQRDGDGSDSSVAETQRAEARLRAAGQST